MFFIENFNAFTNKKASLASNEENNDRIIELQQGCVKNLIHIDKSIKNLPRKHFWRDWKYLGMMFVDYFFLNLGNLLFLISFIMIVAFNDEITSLMPLVLLFVFFPLYILQKLFIDYQNHKNLLLESMKPIKKIDFSGIVLYRDILWKDLMVGDIILLKRDEVIPADILLLDCENDICLLQTSAIDGKSGFTKKKPLKLTNVFKHSPLKGNLEEYKKNLTAKIQYEAASKDFNQFKGTLKLKKDPISEEITINSVLLKGSTLTYSDWIIGLVLFVGKEVKCACSEAPLLSKFGREFFYNQLLNRVNFLILIILSIEVLACTIRVSSNNDYFQRIFEENVVGILITNFVIIIPTNLYTLLHGFAFLYKYLLEKHHKGSMFVNNPSKLSYMNQITHLVLDKNAILENPIEKTFIHSLYIPKNKHFFITPFGETQEKKKKKVFLEKLAIVNRSIIKDKSNQNQMKNIDLLKTSHKEPKIILPADNETNSLKMTVCDELGVPPIPVSIPMKFTPSSFQNEVAMDTSNSFQGQGETQIIDRMKEDPKEKEMTVKFPGETQNKLHIQSEKLVDPNSPFTKQKNTLSFSELSENEKLSSFSDLCTKGTPVLSKYADIFKSLLLCHDIRSKLDYKKIPNSEEGTLTPSFFHEAALPDTITIQNFAEEYNYKFVYQCSILNNMIKCYNAKVNDDLMQYYILGTHFSVKTHYKFSILVKKSSAARVEANVSLSDFEDNPILYLRTNDVSYLDIADIEETERESLKLRLEAMKHHGLRFVLFFQKRTISDEEAGIYVKYYKNHSENEDKIKNLEAGLELVTILAIKDKVFPGLTPMISDFLNINNKVWLLSNDPEDSVIATGYLLELLVKDGEVIRLEIPSESCNVNEAWIKIRAALNKLKKILLIDHNINSPSMMSALLKSKAKARKSMAVDKNANLAWNSYNNSKYSVIINGRTLDIISKDEDLMSHLVFIAYFSKALIGYEMNPESKGLLVKMIKNQFPGNPITMGVGVGYDDQLMIQNSDISIQKKPKLSGKEEKTNKNKSRFFTPKSHCGCLEADFSVDCFKLLRELVRLKSMNFNYKLIIIILFCYGSSFLFVTPYILYVIFFGVLTGPLISPYLFMLKDVIVLNSLSFLIFFWGKKPSFEILKTFVWTYKDGRLAYEHICKTFSWWVFIHSSVDALFVFIFAVYGVDFVLSGNQQLYDEFVAILYSVLFFMIFQKVMFNYNSPYIMLFLSMALAVLIYFLTALILSRASSNIVYWDMLESILMISSEGEVILLILFLHFLTLVRIIFYKFILMEKLIFVNYGEIIKYLQQEMPIEYIKNRLLSQNQTKNDHGVKNFNEVLRKIFKYRKMDIIVQEMLNPNEIAINERGYHKLTLNFKDKELEMQYLNQIKKFSIRKKKVISTLSLAFFLIIIIFLLVLTYKYDKIIHINITMANVSFVLALLVNQLLLRLENVSSYYKIIRFFIPFCTFIFNILCLSFSIDNNFNSLITIYILIFSTIFQSEYIEEFIHYFLMCFSLFILVLVKLIASVPIFTVDSNFILESQTSQKVSLIIEATAIVFYEIYSKYKKEQTYRNIFLNERGIKQENKKIGELLSILVPGFVRESLIQGEESLSEDQGDVTILFCDICNFDKIVKQENKGVIHILDKLYRMFDSFCLENDVQKIETVGKTYMACGGLKAVESTLQAIRIKNSTQRVINLALSMMNYAKKLTYSEKIIVKIGIHYGPVIAGVIGYHKPQFSLIGDTVNTTSRVCSTGEESTITISKAAYDKIVGCYKGLDFIERMVEAKGKGQITTYQVKKRRKMNENTVLSIKPSEIKLEEKILEKEKHEQIKRESEVKKDLIDMAKIARKNIKKTTMMMRMGIEKKVSISSPKHNINHSNHSNESPAKSPRNVLRMATVISKKHENTFNFNYPPSILENKSEGTFHRLNSDFKNNFLDEMSNSVYEKKPSFNKLNSGLSKSENFHGSLNLLYYIENEHSKAISNSNKQMLDYIEKKEEFPGQFKSEDINSLRKSGGNNPQNVLSNVNDDEFFDKLKVKENSLEILNYHHVWLTLKDNNAEVVKEFRNTLKEFHFSENIASGAVFSLIYFINTFLVIMKQSVLQNFNILIVIRSLLTLSNCVSLYIPARKSNNCVFIRKFLIFNFFLILNELLFEYILTNYYGLENSLEIILLFLIGINHTYVTFLDTLILAFYALCFILLRTQKDFSIEIFLASLFLFFCLAMILNNQRVKILNFYKSFNTIKINSIKKNQQDKLIVNLLPSHILEKFLRNPNQKLDLTDEFEDVTVLFADIAGFTKYSSTVSPIQVVSVLKDLFTEFDKLCLDNCVYKLYTIGDCYVVLGIIDAEERDVGREAFNVVNMGFQMIEIIKDVKKRVSFHDINMRIGIHTGKIIGGVIGTDIVRYDVYGKDVLIANKMESNGIEGCITVSEKTKEILMRDFPDSFLFGFHKEVHLQSFNETIKAFRVFDMRNEQ